MHRLTAAFFGLALVAFLAGGAGAQGTCGSMDQCAAPAPFDTGLQHELSTAGINALLGGVTAVASRLVRGERIGSAFWAGAVGGGVTYAGKRVAVEGFYGAGLVGRELASVGGSIVRNASAGRDALEELVLPVGPVRLYVSRANGIVPRVDVGTLIASGAFMLAYDGRLDLGESLSAGALVFRGDAPMPGLTSAGAVTVWRDEALPENERLRLLAHERVHVLQYDQAFLTVGEGLERWIVNRSAPNTRILDHLDFGALALGLRGSLGYTLHYQDRPWEKEAYFLAQSAHPVAGHHSH